MKATTLSISVANSCNKDCPYCVSKMTKNIKPDYTKFERNLDKVLNFAKMANITSVIITGKGEPITHNNMSFLSSVCKVFKDFPLEIQTNGLELIKKPEIIEYLTNDGVDTFAISIDNPSYLVGPFMNGLKMGANIRYTINLHKAWNNFSFNNILDMIKEQGLADQFSFRRLTYPNFVRDEKVKDWIIENECASSYDRIIDSFDKKKYPVVRKLPYGATLYDVDGIGFTYFDFCIQEESGEDDIRSLIYQLDGHLYTSWESSPASRIF
jgi:MoaA/NifB/PqqE/SkfB family radical SAM enzyme